MTEIPRSLISRTDLSHPEVRLLTVLYAMCPWWEAHDPFVSPTIEQLAERTGMSESAVKRAIRGACKKTDLERVKRGHLGFRLPPHPEASATAHLCDICDAKAKHRASG